MPKVSVLMPIYRTKESYLRTAIDSILNQTFTDFEFLILDDCPNDSREEIVKSYHDPRIIYLTNERNLGITPSRNKLIELAKGEYLAVMDHDDISLPRRFEKQVSYLDAHKNVGVVGCLAEQFPEHAIYRYPEKNKDIKARLTYYNGILHPASMICKSVLMDYDIRYEEKYSPAEDQGLWVALMDYTDFYNIQEILFRYRHHEHNTTHRQIDQIIAGAEEVHYLARKKHPELIYHFFHTLEICRIFYIFQKYPLLSIAQKNGKLIFSLFNKIPIFSCISNKDMLIRRRKYTKVKIKKDDMYADNLDALQFVKDVVKYQKESVGMEVWFCHALGGGADIYFREQMKLNNSVLYVEVQDLNVRDSLKISYFYKEYSDFIVCNYKNAEVFLNKLSPQKIVINNLAFYFNLKKIVNLIKSLKENLKCFVSFRGHDFQPICPNVHMLNSENKYCRCTNFKQCKSCLKRIKKPIMKIRSIPQYEKLWQEFLYNVVDEVILFSNATFQIYQKFYPLLKQKVKIVPHTIEPLVEIKVKKHSAINVAILGNCNVEKGLNIIKEIDQLIIKYSNVSFNVIGETKENFQNIRVFGRYKKEQLPEIVEKNQIDIIFIASIIPETFSYTTAEAMSMGLPVACFDLGAQAERIKQYSKGLIIDQIDAKYALEKIIHFVETERKIK